LLKNFSEPFNSFLKSSLEIAPSDSFDLLSSISFLILLGVKLHMRKKEQIQKLSLIKFLLAYSKDKLKSPHPINSLAILMLQDALELFLDLVANEIGLTVEDRQFMKYIKQINTELDKKGENLLSETTGLEKINKSRVNFKHYGIPIASEFVEESYYITSSFLESNTLRFFKIHLEDISLVELISDDVVKSHLMTAISDYREERIDTAISNLAISFSSLLRNYESNKLTRSWKSAFYFGENQSFFSMHEIRQTFGSEISGFFEKTNKNFDLIRASLKMLAFGIDYRKFVKFSSLTPHVSWSMGGKWYVDLGMNNTKGISNDDFDFCVSFIIESSLKMQEFDFSLDR
jgi:hypothetical protein